MQEFKILRRKQSQEGDTGSKQEPVPVRAFNLMKMEATNVLFPDANPSDQQPDDDKNPAGMTHDFTPPVSFYPSNWAEDRI